MNHDSKHNDFEYEKETFPKTPEHFKQLVVNQVAQEQQKKNISPIKSKKKWMPAKVAAVIIVFRVVIHMAASFSNIVRN